MVPELTYDEPWQLAPMTHETILVKETIGTQNGHGGVTVAVAPAVRLRFTGRHTP